MTLDSASIARGEMRYARRKRITIDSTLYVLRTPFHVKGAGYY